MTVKEYVIQEIDNLKTNHPKNEKVQELDFIYMYNNLVVYEVFSNLEEYCSNSGIFISWHDNLTDQVKNIIDADMREFILYC